METVEQPRAAVARPGAPARIGARVVLLMNFITPHTRDVLVELSRRVRKLTVLLSTPMEENRCWDPCWSDLDVCVQRTVTIRRVWRHAAGFRDASYLHVPWNTLGLLRGLRPDVIVSTEFGFRTLFCALYRMVCPSVRLVVFVGLSEHTERGRGWARNLLRRWLARRLDAIMVNGASGRRYLERLGCDPQRIFASPYAAAPECIENGPPVRAPAVAHRLLYAGQFVERKGVLPFLEALVRWAGANPRREASLTLVGSGPLRAQIESMPRPANLAIELVGQQPPDELRAIYARSGILVLPTLADEWGLVVNEAMASGLPVLGSVFSQAVEELCEEGVSGWTFRPDVPGEMDSALARAMATPAADLDRMRAAARQRVGGITPAYAAESMLKAIGAALEGQETRQ